MSAKSGQVAVILILVVAAALIFYAASINLGRLSQTKILTTIAADTGAATLASYMASFGHSIFKTTLGGQKRKCGGTFTLVSLLAVIIAVVVIIYYPGASTSVIAWVGLVLSMGALTLQVMVIQPGITDAWNDIPWHTMDTEDAILEQGVQKALSSAVTDNILVADMDDSDMDRLWGKDAGLQPLDKISRFGLYYTEKRINTIPVSALAQIRDFLDALRNFLLDAGDDWGLFDDTGPVCEASAVSECDPCCLPFGARDSSSCGDTPVYDVDGNLTGYTENAGVRSACEAGSPYGDGVSSNYPWVYDAYRGNAENAFISFQEQLGRDDEHQFFEKKPAAPNGTQTSVLLPPPPLPPTNFKLKDATAYYPNPPEDRAGIFPFFYKIADWGVDLQSLVTNVPLNPQCNWCATGGGTTCDAAATYPPDFSQLLPLPVNPATLTYNTSYCVDGTNLVSGNPPLAVDRVTVPTGILAAVSQCAENARSDPAIGFWKRGGDRFCAVDSDLDSDIDWPYGGQCLKFGPACLADDQVTCLVCGETDPAGWPDDLVDDVLYGLNWFIDWAKEFVAGDPTQLANNFKTWYPEAAQWIEPGTDPDPVGSSAVSGTNCYTCNPKDGALHVWWKEIREMRDRLIAWRDTSFAGAACTDVWCVPGSGCWAGRDSTAIGGSGPEANTFGAGTLANVVSCLNWNIADAGGNAVKFQNCENFCAASDYASANLWCGSLPRSLVPGLDGSYVPADLAYLACPATCSACYSTCVTTCVGSADPLCTSVCQSACTCGGCVCSDVLVNGACYTAGLPAARGSCGDPTFRARLQQSIPEAQNQAAKFLLRRDFLSGRLTELNEIITILDGAEQKFAEFLNCPNGAACKLIEYRIAFDSLPSGLPYQAIYGWQSEPGKGGDPGKWHIVRVDARLPGRCDKDCNINQTPEDDDDPVWPWVETYTRGSISQTRCYELTSTNGLVKVRVTRFDESGAFATFLFPSAVEIWKPTLDRPDRPQTALSNPADLAAACIDQMIPNSNGIPATAMPGTDYYGAFMLNERNPVDPGCINTCMAAPDPPGCISACVEQSNQGCWDLANQLLSRGVTSEACAQYYFHEGDPYGMDFKFVPCANF